MAVTKQILKNTQTEAVIKFVGLGTIALTIAELKNANETLATAPTLEILRVKTSAAPTSAITLTRNAIDVLQLFGTVDFVFEGMKDIEQRDKDFSIVTAANGTLILTLRKNGYIGPGRSTYLTGGA